jgi:hypothetical protein
MKKLPLVLECGAGEVGPLLERLVALGYLLHGSPHKLNCLIPQIPRAHGERPVNQQPEIYATNEPKHALFYAVARNCHNGQGYVYICAREGFACRFPFESYSTYPVKPLLRISVRRNDIEYDGQSIFEVVNEILNSAMAEGGSIISGGLIRGHEGEEVSPANVVAGSKTTLERISDLFSGHMGGAAGGQSVSIQAPPVTINIARVEKDVDVDRIFEKASEEFDRKLLFRLRNSLDTLGLRGIGYLRG